MKKLLILALIAVFSVAFISGCKSSPEPSPSGSESPSGSSTPSESPSTSAGSAKTGMAVLTTLAKSAEATDTTDGLAEIDSTVAAVTVNQDGKIMGCVIDAVQAKIYFDKTGKLLTPADTKIKTNNELGESWFDQAAAFAQYVKGMTAEEVKNIKVDEENYPIEPDLKASVKISIGNFVKCIEKAAMEAKEGGAAESDKLSIGAVPAMNKSAGATNSKEGLAQVDTAYAAVTRDAGGKISSCLIDASESGVSFTGKGKITTDLTAEPKTNNELKEAYGLKEASGIDKEWFEQAESFAQYVTGKKPAEVEGIAVDDRGYAVAEDLKSSITIPVGDLKAAVLKAVGGV